MPREWIISEEDLGVDGEYFSHEEIIRCKDCKYWGGSKYSNSHETDFVCEYWESDGLMWNDYCSFGKRREDAETD